MFRRCRRSGCGFLLFGFAVAVVVSWFAVARAGTAAPVAACVSSALAGVVSRTAVAFSGAIASAVSIAF